MKLARTGSTRAFTRTELLVISVVVVLLAALLMPALAMAKAKAGRIKCVHNLRSMALAFRVFANDQATLRGEELFSFDVSTNKGGSREYIGTGQMFRHFQVMSNDLGSAMLLTCPTDVRQPRLDFLTDLSNSNVSYFLDIDARLTRPQIFLAGDRTLTNDLPLRNGIMELNPYQRLRWVPGLHGRAGNVSLSDGSVQQWNHDAITYHLNQIGPVTNRLEFP